MIENIKALIAKKGLTQKSIATEIGLSEKSLGNFLNGKSSLNSDALNRLLLFLGFDLDKEIGMEELENNYKKNRKKKEKKQKKGKEKERGKR